MNLAPVLLLLLSLLATGDGKRPPFLRTFGGGVASRMAAPARDVYYIRTGDTLYVRGAISATKHIAQKYYLKGTDNTPIEWSTAFIIPPTNPYTLAGMRADGKIISMGGDDAAPISTAHLIGYLMGNHGLVMPVVRSTGHNKDATDIGSYWSDGTYTFMLAGVSGEYLTFYSLPYAYLTTWLMRTTVAAAPQKMGCVGGSAAHTDSITVTSQSATQRFPIVTNVTRSFLKNGSTAIAAGDEGYASFVDLVETFSLMDPSTMDTTQTTNPWVYNDCASTWMTVSHTYRATPGCTVIHTTYNQLRPMLTAYTAFVQQSNMTGAAYVNRFLYIPRLKDTSKFTYRNLWNTAAATGFSTDSMRTAGKYVNRQMVLWQATGDTVDIAHAMGLVMAGDGADGAGRTLAAGYSIWSLSADGKCYAKASSGQGLVAPRTYDAYAYRQFVDPKAYWRDKTAYWHTAGSYDYVYIDYHDAVTADATVLPEKMWGKTITVMDTLNVHNISATVPSTGILVTVTPGDTLGYAVLRLQ